MHLKIISIMDIFLSNTRLEHKIKLTLINIHLNYCHRIYMLCIILDIRF